MITQTPPAAMRKHGIHKRTSINRKSIIGMATIHIVNNMGKRIAHVDDVVISDAYRRQGLGTKIMRELMNVAKSRGVSQLRLTSRSARVAANKLYQQMGFKIANTNVYVMTL